MTYYLKSGAQFNVTTKDALDIHDTLPLDTYTVRQNQMTGEYYLEAVEGFEVSGKLYGDTEKRAERILNTFAQRSTSTGVMLSGEKGSGKTLLAKLISQKSMEDEIPTIIINQPHSGEAFNQFMQKIEQPVIVLFDEFEKVYDDASQEQMLTLLDGVYPSKKLFILTCNDSYRVNSHMHNRPGRIFYSLKFDGLSPEFIREYCEDNLKDKGQIDSVVRISSVFGKFNFDMLKAMVEEMNRYGETPQEAMEMLNAKPEQSGAQKFMFVMKDPNGDVVSEERLLEGTHWHGNPLVNRINIFIRGGDAFIDGGSEKDDDSELTGLDAILKSLDMKGDYDGDVTVAFEPTDLVRVDAHTGGFEYKNKQGFTVSLTREVESRPAYYSAAF